MFCVCYCMYMVNAYYIWTWTCVRLEVQKMKSPEVTVCGWWGYKYISLQWIIIRIISLVLRFIEGWISTVLICSSFHWTWRIAINCCNLFFMSLKDCYQLFSFVLRFIELEGLLSTVLICSSFHWMFCRMLPEDVLFLKCGGRTAHK